MKQSILFEQGKLYVVELPERILFTTYAFSPGACEKYEQSLKQAFANKVEVKNPEEIKKIWWESDSRINNPISLYNWERIILRDGDTFPLPADLTFDKETGMLKRIEPEKKEKPVNMKWIKGTDRLPQHMIYVHVKVDGAKYAAYYDHSLKLFLLRVGDRGFALNDVEWLDETIEPEKPEETQDELKTLQSCKEEIAKRHSFDDWNHLKKCHSGKMGEYCDLVCELYASQFTIQRKKS